MIHRVTYITKQTDIYRNMLQSSNNVNDEKIYTQNM